MLALCILAYRPLGGRKLTFLLVYHGEIDRNSTLIDFSHPRGDIIYSFGFSCMSLAEHPCEEGCDNTYKYITVGFSFCVGRRVQVALMKQGVSDSTRFGWRMLLRSVILIFEEFFARLIVFGFLTVQIDTWRMTLPLLL